MCVVVVVSSGVRQLPAGCGGGGGLTQGIRFRVSDSIIPAGWHAVRERECVCGGGGGLTQGIRFRVRSQCVCVVFGVWCWTQGIRFRVSDSLIPAGWHAAYHSTLDSTSRAITIHTVLSGYLWGRGAKDVCTRNRTLR